MLINSICLCRVVILIPPSRLPAYKRGLTLGPGYPLEEKSKKEESTSEPSQAVVWEREREKRLPPPRLLCSLVHRFSRRRFLLFHPISYPGPQTFQLTK